MVRFIDEHRATYGVEPICEVLPIAPSTYYEQKARAADPTRLPKRAQRDAELRVEMLEGIAEDAARLVTVARARTQLGDTAGLDTERAQLDEAYGVMEQEMESKTWTMGSDFTLADCAAAPALFYANTVLPFAETHKNLRDYLDRLMVRPSFARVLEEAQPYFGLFPMDQKPQIARPAAVAGL